SHSTSGKTERFNLLDDERARHPEHVRDLLGREFRMRRDQRDSTAAGHMVEELDEQPDRRSGEFNRLGC
ncbi:MAG: hypothetical protein ACK56F_01730, partial [bacterium]